ncbi:MAG TPA: hypothetical protein VF832_09810 [Longimicrobiales bacterium]
MNSWLQAVRVGAETGICAATIQACVGEAIDGKLLPEGRLADRAVGLLEAALDEPREQKPTPPIFLSAAAFHFGYGAGWGALYALARERLRVPALAAAALQAAAIYTLAFSRVSAGVRLGSEPHPSRRRPGELAFQLVMAGTFALSNAALYEAVRSR